MFPNKKQEPLSNWWDAIEEPPSEDEVGLYSLGTDESGVRYDVDSLATDRVEAGSPSSPTNEGNRPGGGYDREVVESVWEFAEAVPGNDADLWRKDEFGNWINRHDYGQRGSEFGWEIFDPGIGRHNQGVYAMRPMQWQSFIAHYEALG